MNMNVSTTIMFHWLYDYDDQREHVKELAQAALDVTATESDAASLLSYWLEEEYKETAPKISGVYGELFKAALDLVIFEQIAQRFISESYGGKAMETYRQMTARHQKEVNEFLDANAFFAFNSDQYAEGLQKFSISEENAPTLLCSISAGGFILKAKYNDYVALAEKLYRERHAAIHDPDTGYQFALGMFEYELANHEFSYTQELAETLDCLGYTLEDITADPTLSAALLQAIQNASANEQ